MDDMDEGGTAPEEGAQGPSPPSFGVRALQVFYAPGALSIRARMPANPALVLRMLDIFRLWSWVFIAIGLSKSIRGAA